MAKRKKAKTKKARDTEGPKEGDSAEGLFLDLCLNSIAELEGDGVQLEAQGPADPLLDELSALVSPQELEILRLSGAFGDVKLKLGEKGAENIEHKQYDRHAMGGATASATARFRAPPPPVPIFAEFPGKGSSMALAGELRYLQTVLQPAEMRWLVAELACDLLEDAPVTHTDISDAVIASIAPSTAQKVAFQADAQYKYTTAQFLQVYMKMRHVVLEHKLLLGGARADALVLALAPFAREIEPVGPEDEVAVSAVEALRRIMDSEDMLR